MTEGELINAAWATVQPLRKVAEIDEFCLSGEKRWRIVLTLSDGGEVEFCDPGHGGMRDYYGGLLRPTMMCFDLCYGDHVELMESLGWQQAAEG